jgi:hypothetical protein
MQGLRLFITTCALLLALPAARAAEAPALVTLLEGQATVIAGVRAFAAAVGAKLGAGTLVETDGKLALMRLEWPDGSLLDLGPGTKVMLRPAAAAGRKPAQFYLLQGWAKQSQPAAGAGQLLLAAEVAPFKGVLVSQVDEGQTLLFSEQGAIQVTPRRGGAPMALDTGKAAGFALNVQPQVLARPPSPWLQKVPRAFRETIPSRAALVKGPEPTLVQRGPLGYAALQPWLAAEPAVRAGFQQRFAELLADRAFRDAVDQGLAQHPEWEPVLRPPKPPVPRPARKNNETPDQEPPR